MEIKTMQNVPCTCMSIVFQLTGLFPVWFLSLCSLRWIRCPFSKENFWSVRLVHQRLTQYIPKRHQSWHSTSPEGASVDTVHLQKAPALTQYIPRRRQRWHSTSPEGTGVDTVHPQKAPELTQYIPRRHQSWHSTSPEGTGVDTVHPQKAPALTQYISRRHQSWHSTSPEGTRVDTVHPQKAPALTQYIPRRHRSWHSTSPEGTSSALHSATLSSASLPQLSTHRVLTMTWRISPISLLC